MVNQIQEHAHELTEQVNRLLDVAALEAGRLTASPRPVDLADEIADADGAAGAAARRPPGRGRRAAD